MYTELHARSAFSFLEGASLPEELASVCADRGMAAMAGCAVGIITGVAAMAGCAVDIITGVAVAAEAN